MTTSRPPTRTRGPVGDSRTSSSLKVPAARSLSISEERWSKRSVITWLLFFGQDLPRHAAARERGLQCRERPVEGRAAAGHDLGAEGGPADDLGGAGGAADD